MDKDIKKSQLIAYVKAVPYIDISHQPDICRSFGLAYFRSVFQNVYRERFLDYLALMQPTTVATISKATKIPHKLLTCYKYTLQKKGVVKVVYLDRCPTTGSRNVQFIALTEKSDHE